MGLDKTNKLILTIPPLNRSLGTQALICFLARCPRPSSCPSEDEGTVPVLIVSPRNVQLRHLLRNAGLVPASRHPGQSTLLPDDVVLVPLQALLPPVRPRDQYRPRLAHVPRTEIASLIGLGRSVVFRPGFLVRFPGFVFGLLGKGALAGRLEVTGLVTDALKSRGHGRKRRVGRLADEESALAALIGTGGGVDPLALVVVVTLSVRRVLLVVNRLTRGVQLVVVALIVLVPLVRHAEGRRTGPDAGGGGGRDGDDAPGAAGAADGGRRREGAGGGRGGDGEEEKRRVQLRHCRLFFTV
mmetsp:Transcript_4308/g.9092  ORF Transcript_4308/g.9092 Transcript_4308/m.9092 type:complete len:299 (+) Transcript_4308:192-1088(+)